MGSPTVLRLRLPAKAEYLVLGRLVLSGISRSEPVNADELSDLKLALTEACSNSIRHAYAARPGSIDVQFELGDGYIAVEVSDDGPGFDARGLDREAGDAVEPADEGGLGLAIIDAVSDNLDMGTRPDGTGSRLRFVKRLS